MVFLILCPALFLLVLIAAYGVYVMAFRSPNKTQNDDFNVSDSPQMAPFKEETLRMIQTVRAIPYEKVTIRSFDGLTLCGRYYKAAPPTAWQEHGLDCPFDQQAAPLAILFHGWRGTICRDFSGGLKLMVDAGFNVLAIEERSCMESEGHVLSFGVNERKDMLAWIKYGEEVLHMDRILPVGISMGAATVLMNADKVPSSVFGLIADCPYTDPLSIIEKVGTDLHVPKPITRFLAILGARVFGHFNLKDPEADALKAVANTQLPILLIHGEEDHFVPHAMSQKIAKAGPAKVEFHSFPKAGHGLSYLLDKERYITVTLKFIQKHLPLS